MKLVEFIKENENWEELLAGAPYYVKVKRKKFEDCNRALVKFCYTQGMSDFSIPLVRECRGVILEETTWSVVARAMDKFGNYGEEWVDKDSFDWASASVQEKVDGTLIMLYFYDGWRIGTRNTIDAYDAELNQGVFNSFGDLALYTFKKVLYKNGRTFDRFCENLNTQTTYWFELVSPCNRVIVDYKGYNLYFLGWRYKHWSNSEYLPKDSICSKYFSMPKRYPLHSLADCVAAAREMGADEEGFVVCDKDFNRMKIKSPKYLELAYLHNNGVWSDKRMLDVIIKGEDAEVLVYFPEWKERFKNLEVRKAWISHKAEAQLATVLTLWSVKIDRKRAEYAQLVKKYVDREFWGYCFWYFDHANEERDFSKWAETHLTLDKYADLLKEVN